MRASLLLVSLLAAPTVAEPNRPHPRDELRSAWRAHATLGVRDASIVWRTSDGPITYAAPPGTHVILDATEGTTLSAARGAAGGNVQLLDPGSGAQKPLVATLDASCAITSDPEAAAASAIGTRPARTRQARSARSGCCGAEAAPGQSFAMVFLVLVFLRRRTVRR